MQAICVFAGKKDAAKLKKCKPLEGRAVFLDLVGRKKYISFEKRLKLLGAVCCQQLLQYTANNVMILCRGSGYL